MGVRAVIHRRGNRKRSFVFTGARNMLPERRALVAQLVEQRFCKPKVGGSIPSGGTSFHSGMVASLPLLMLQNIPAVFYEAFATSADALTLVNVLRTLTDL